MSESDALIQVQNLCKTFDGQTMVLDDVCLEVYAGSVYGLIGENGAGKTTLIRHLIGRTLPTSGEVRMFGFDPIAAPAEVLGKVGYLSEPRDTPQWMRTGELIDYMSSFYPNWDEPFAQTMRDAFQLSRSTYVSDLSRGQAARLGLLLAVAHRPPLLILDEPSSGLDPVVRSDILGEIIRSVADDGRTVFFSSHLLDEIEQIADRVGIMNNGRLIIDAPTKRLGADYVLLKLKLDGTTQLSAAPETSMPETVVSQYRDGRTWQVLCEISGQDECRQLLGGSSNVGEVTTSTLSLHELFTFLVNSGRQATANIDSVEGSR